MKELIAIQSELKAPKNQFNSFGKYKYRSCEDILEALKPLLKAHNCYLTLSDELVNIGDRYYIKSTATIYSEKTSVSLTGYARDEETKKGIYNVEVLLVDWTTEINTSNFKTYTTKTNEKGNF
jgi:hypothetical protein